MSLFIQQLWENPPFFFAVAIIVIFSICCHEFMHAYIALKAGDPTAADAGHLTLNPFRQMGLWSLIIFAFFGLAWGQVPVRHDLMRHRHGPALVAFAGPATNLALAVGFTVLCFVCFKLQLGTEFTWEMLYYAGELNVVLFLLNLFPVPGFDGWYILENFFPRFVRQSSEAVRGAFFVMIMLLFVFIDQLYAIGSFLVGNLLFLLQSLTEQFPG